VLEDWVDWSVLALAAVIILAAAVISGITGFGFGLISVPPLLMFFDPPAVLTITKILTISTTWIVIASAWREVKPGILLRILPLSIVGATLGLQLLRIASAEVIKIITSSIVVAFALLLIRGLPQREIKHPLLAPFAGFVSGVMSTSTALSGPPIILYLTVSKIPVHAFRVTIATYFVLLDFFGMPALIRGDFVTRHDLKIALMLIPAAFIGRFAGSRLSSRFSREQFFRFTLGILIATGALGIVSTAFSLLG
jgi:uncharacterized membrane protein YfcA